MSRTADLAVGDHVGDLGGVAAVVLAVDVLDDLLVAVGLDVHIFTGLRVWMLYVRGRCEGSPASGR